MQGAEASLFADLQNVKITLRVLVKPDIECLPQIHRPAFTARAPSRMKRVLLKMLYAGSWVKDIMIKYCLPSVTKS